MLVSPLFRITSSVFALLLAAQLNVQPVAALCNLSATIECCELVLPASDPVSALVLSLANIQAPLASTQIGIACNPFSSTSTACGTNLVGCDNKPHPAIGTGCGLHLQIAT
ncbi:hypothetical protein QCA50_018244 [Cerrena zonata]|uniref:Hydrophobin n=1 Tax=Cerrena zonata TaxID=2478898 RepID=A0AAW0FM46_9APHY